MKVWLVWTGHYSDAKVVGVYSSLELAEAAVKLCGEVWGRVGDGFEIDADANMVRAGVSRWIVTIDIDNGAVAWVGQTSVGTGEPPVVTRYGRKLTIDCDTRDKDHAVKIAGDERTKWLVTNDQGLKA